jgi:hypothetical protein
MERPSFAGIQASYVQFEGFAEDGYCSNVIDITADSRIIVM